MQPSARLISGYRQVTCTLNKQRQFTPKREPLVNLFFSVRKLAVFEMKEQELKALYQYVKTDGTPIS